MSLTPSERKRVDGIRARMIVIKDLSDVNPLLVDFLNSIAKDVDWLCDHIEMAWSIVEAYQEEIRKIYERS
jgi:hypothetical protein